MLVIFAASGVCGIVIIGELRKMMRTVMQKNCFIHENVKSLEMMGITSAVIVLLFFIKCSLPFLSPGCSVKCSPLYSGKRSAIKRKMI